MGERRSERGGSEALVDRFEDGRAANHGVALFPDQQLDCPSMRYHPFHEC